MYLSEYLCLLCGILANLACFETLRSLQKFKWQSFDITSLHPLSIPSHCCVGETTEIKKFHWWLFCNMGYRRIYWGWRPKYDWKKSYLNTRVSVLRSKVEVPWTMVLWKALEHRSPTRDGEGMKGGYCISIHVAFGVKVQRWKVP